MSSNVVSLFQGYKTFTDAGVSSAVTGKTLNGGASNEIKIHIVTDRESLSKSINISGSASVSYLGDSVSDKAKFINSLDITSYSISILAYGKEISEHLVGTNPEWSKNSSPASSNSLAFYRAYGDSYISEIVKGGEFIGIYTFNSQSEADQQSIQNELHAKGIFSGVTVSADLSATLSTISSSTKTNLSFQYQLFGYTTQAFKTLPSENLFDFTQNIFPNTKPDSPIVISYKATGYEDIITTADGYFDSIAATRKFFSSLYSANVIALESVNSSCDSIYKIYSEYGLSPNCDSDFYSKAAQIKADLSTLKDLFDKMTLNPTNTYTLPKISSIDYGAPTINFNINSVHCGGGDGGGYFEDVSSVDVLNCTKISSLFGAGGSWVDNLDITYSNGNSYKHGGDGGNYFPLLQLQPKENIVQVSAAFGAYVNALYFETSNGQTYLYPNQFSASYTWTKKDNEVLIGFGGRAGQYLDNLNIIVCTFLTATWDPKFSSLLIQKFILNNK